MRNYPSLLLALCISKTPGRRPWVLNMLAKGTDLSHTIRMRFFLAFFFLIYASLHAYVFLRAYLALHFSPLSGLGIAFVMAAMIVAPVVVRLAETARLDFLARFMAYIGYAWLGVLFLIVCSLAAVDLYRLLLWTIGKVFQADASRLSLSTRSYFLIALSVAALVAVYGYFEALNVGIDRVIIRTSKPLPEKNPIRIVQISDVHLGLIVGAARLSRILERVRETKPDIVISTGDLVDGPMSPPGADKMLAAIRPEYGKFAVTGNHEFYAGLGHSLAFTERAGFRMLRGEAVTTAGMVIVGIDDSAGPGYGPAEGPGEIEILACQPRDRFILFLKHRPVFSSEEIGLFDLQVSGHIHGGQIFPFRLITRLFFSHIAGLYDLGKGSKLFVSRGSGTWGPPMRFLSPPEVVVIDIIAAPSH